jgi:hypothetical protein
MICPTEKAQLRRRIIMIGQPEGARNQRMIFALVKIGGFKTPNQDYAYRTVIVEKGASAKWVNNFDTEDELIAVVNPILARQRIRGDVRLLLCQIRHGDDCYFFDLDLSAQEAKSLGWQRYPLR